MAKMSADTGITLDEELQIDLGLSKERESNFAAEDRKIEEAVKKARAELKALLNQPIDVNNKGPISRNNGGGNKGKKPGKSKEKGGQGRGERIKKDPFVVFAK